MANEDVPSGEPTYTYRRTDTIIQGVGDEIFVVIVSSLVMLISILVLMRNFLGNIRRETHVHPLAQEDVERVRQTHNASRRGSGPVEGEDGEDVPVRNNANIPRGNNIGNVGEQGCPICLVEMVEAMETNCGHIFCANCFWELWRRSTSWPAAARCPICRQLVTLLLYAHEPQPGEESEAMREIASYNRRMSGAPRPFMDYIRDMPTLTRHLFQELFSPRGIFLLWKIRVFLLIILVLLYVLSPLDIVPESIFGLVGIIDDVVITMLIVFLLTFIYRTAIIQRRN